MKIRVDSGLKWNFLSKIRCVLTGTGGLKQHIVSGLAGIGIINYDSTLFPVIQENDFGLFRYPAGNSVSGRTLRPSYGSCFSNSLA